MLGFLKKSDLHYYVNKYFLMLDFSVSNLTKDVYILLEVLSPHRPPAPPTEYFQFNIGGYDPANLLRTNLNTSVLEGYIGCVRGLKIGEHLIDLAEINERNIAQGKFKSLADLKNIFYHFVRFSYRRCSPKLSNKM